MAWRIAWFATAFLIICGGLVLWPGIDLWASGLFYRAGAGFFWGDWAPFRLVHQGLPYAVIGFGAAVAAALIAALWLRRPILGLDAKAACFLLLSLALGPGLIVNTIFKDHWGRARPAQIIEFGGDKKFTPAFRPSDQCQHNCSFPAGDPAMGYYLVSAAFLIPAARQRRQGIAAAVTLGAALGVVRIAQGGHFLSDVVASGFFVYAASWLLHRTLIAQDGFATLGNALRRPSIALQRFAWLTLACGALFAFSYVFIDVPVARYFHDSDPLLQRVFAVITRLGEGSVYLLPLGVAILWALGTRQRDLARRASFVFAAVAIPGLFADIVKPVFGRARPELLFRDQLFGFTWNGPHADLWSFPSGHAITVVALGTALYAIYPPLWPAYAALALLVGASRVIIGAHYVSDVIAGAYIGFVAAWILAAAIKRSGIALALRPEKFSDSP